MRSDHELMTPIELPNRAHTGGPRRPWIWLALLVTAVAVVGAALLVWQQAQGSNAIAVAAAERDEALAEVGALSARIQGLEDRLAGASAGQAELRRELGDARATLEAMLGPALPDGRHFGRLVAVGATQEPPRLVIDVEQWFTGEEAAQAAIEDGVLAPGETAIENDFFIRNVDTRWRVLEVDPATEVSLTTYPFGQIDAPGVVTFARFEELFDGGDDTLLRLFPYWITVRDGIVVAVDEQYTP